MTKVGQIQISARVDTDCTCHHVTCEHSIEHGSGTDGTWSTAPWAPKLLPWNQRQRRRRFLRIRTCGWIGNAAQKFTAQRICLP
jgi:hypothetical protein